MIEIKNCNNIDNAKITVNNNALNLKFATKWTWNSSA